MILKETKYNEISVTNNIYKNLYYLHELEIKYNLLNNPQFKKYWYIDPEQGEEKYYHAQERKQVINPKLKKQVNDISKWLLSYYYIVLQSWYQTHNFYDKTYPLICQVSRGNVIYKLSDVEEESRIQYTNYLTVEQQKGRLSDILMKFDNYNQSEDIVLFTLLHLMIIGGNDSYNSIRQREMQYDNQIRNQLEYLINLYLKISDKDFDILSKLLDIDIELEDNMDENIIVTIFNNSNINPIVYEILQEIQNISKITNKNKLMNMIEYIIMKNLYNEDPISVILNSDELIEITDMQILAKDKLLPGDQKKKDKMFYNYIEKYLAPVRKERMKQLTGQGSKFFKTNLEKAREAIDLCYKTLKSLDSIPETEKIYKLMVIMNRIEGLVHSNGDILDYMPPDNLYITDISLDYPYEGIDQYLYPNMFDIMVDQIYNKEFYEYFEEIDDISKFFEYDSEDEHEFTNEIGKFSNFGQYLSFLSNLDKKQPKIFNEWIDDLVSYGISPDIKTYMQV